MIGTSKSPGVVHGGNNGGSDIIRPDTGPLAPPVVVHHDWPAVAETIEMRGAIAEAVYDQAFLVVGMTRPKNRESKVSLPGRILQEIFRGELVSPIRKTRGTQRIFLRHRHHAKGPLIDAGGATKDHVPSPTARRVGEMNRILQGASDHIHNRVPRTVFAHSANKLHRIRTVP